MAFYTRAAGEGPEFLPIAADDEGPQSAPRYTVDITAAGWAGQYAFTVDLGAGTYDEVRFNGYDAASQPLNIIVDGRNNLNAFRVAAYGVQSTGTMTVYGHAGNDLFASGNVVVGTNTFHGGTGDDVYSAVNVVELAGEGTDTLYSQQADVTLGANVENLIYGYIEHFGSAFSHALRPGYSTTAIGRGNGENNAISGFGTQYGYGGNDTLTGGALADTLLGGAGNDTLNGGDGADTASYADAAAAVFVTLDQPQAIASNDGDGGVDLLNGIENLTGSAFNDVLIGQAGANVLTGGAGGDYLIGLGGNDQLYGGVGAANTLQGGLGDDTYFVEAAGDSLIEMAGEGYDTIQTTLSSLTMRTNFERMIYTGSGSFAGTGSVDANLIVGGGQADTLAGMGGNDVLQGGGGDDVLRGGAGTDQLDGGAGAGDTADYSTAGAGVVVSLANQLTSNDGEGGTDALLNMENATGSNFNDVLIGTHTGAVNIDNVLSGGAGYDVLIGHAGNDTLIGGSGAANELYGGVGDDRYIVNAFDTIIENAGEGTDTVETAFTAYTLRTNVENLVYTGQLTIAAVGNASNNAMTGGNGADTFTGLSGDDTLTGGGGIDTVVMRGVRADYTIQIGGSFTTIGDSVAGRDGIDTLFGIEQIRFSDGSTLDITAPPAAPVEAARVLLENADAGALGGTGDTLLTLPGVDDWTFQ